MYPNPFTDKVTLSYTSGKAQQKGIRILDNNGNAVYSAKINVQAGKNIIPIGNLARNAAGAYILELKTDNTVYTQQIVK